jgi:hypothetical protein
MFARGGRGEHVGARVANLVHAMAEAHEALAALDLLPEHLLRARGVADLEHHVERGPRRAAMKGPFQRADRARGRRDEVGAGRHDHARGERRCVEPVIGHRR